MSVTQREIEMSTVLAALTDGPDYFGSAHGIGGGFRVHGCSPPTAPVARTAEQKAEARARRKARRKARKAGRAR